MQEPVVSLEQARKEVEQWLDSKKISEKKRAANENQIDVLVDAISQGDLLLKEDNVFVHKLKFPLDSPKTTELEYKQRLTLSETHVALQNVKQGDNDGRLLAYVCALTLKTKGVLGKLDTGDYDICVAIAVFFA